MGSVLESWILRGQDSANSLPIIISHATAVDYLKFNDFRSPLWLQVYIFSQFALLPVVEEKDRRSYLENPENLALFLAGVKTVNLSGHISWDKRLIQNLLPNAGEVTIDGQDIEL